MTPNFNPVEEVVTQLEVAREQDLTVNRVHLTSSPAKEQKLLPLTAPHGWQNATIYKQGRKKRVGGEVVGVVTENRCNFCHVHTHTHTHAPLNPAFPHSCPPLRPCFQYCLRLFSSFFLYSPAPLRFSMFYTPDPLLTPYPPLLTCRF